MSKKSGLKIASAVTLVKRRVDEASHLRCCIVCVSGHDCWQDGVEDGGCCHARGKGRGDDSK